MRNRSGISHFCGVIMRFIFPVQGYKGTVPLHWGISNHAADLFGAIGTPILAMENGVVQSVGVNDVLGGNNVSYKGDSGLTYYCAHMRDKPLVSASQRLTMGASIGLLGKTGNAATTDAHLHIGIGYGIQDGSGAEGGAGIGFDCTQFLRDVLTGKDIANLSQYGGSGAILTGGGSGDTGGSTGGTSDGTAGIPGFALLWAILKGFAALWSGRQ